MFFDFLQNHIRNIRTVERDRIEKEPMSGFPRFVNSEILVMTKIYDFHDEGILVLKTANISDAYSKESDAFYEKIYRKYMSASK